MPLITPADLCTHIYPEIMDEITRNNQDVVFTAINAATQEAKLYLSRYDLLQLFGTDTIDPTITDPLLQSLLKDIAAWHLIRLSATAIDNATCRTAYEDAVKTLKSIMDGKAVPDGWPYLDTATTASLPEGSTVSWSSNARRHNHY